MRVLLFDLDFTLANTTACLPYLTTSRGRGQVVDALEEGEIAVSLYDERLVESFNDSFRDGLCAVVVSDSPKAYCLKVLEMCGYEIDSDLVFGNQKKPIVDFESLKDSLEDTLEIASDEMEFLVVGDSPKDIYFAHRIQAPSVFAAWGSRHDLNLAQRSRPTRVARNYEQLRAAVIDFLNGEVEFNNYNFYNDFEFCEPEGLDCIELDSDSVGNAREYVPNYEHYRGDNDRWAARDLRWVVKPAKNYGIWHHRRNHSMTLYGADGMFETRSLKSLAGIYKRDFMAWLDELDVHGKVLVVPIPPSVPEECNLSNPVSIIAEWWSSWVTEALDDVDMSSFDVFRRIVPKQPSHDTAGPRHLTDQLPTLGVIPRSRYTGGDVDYVIILDDVVTSGSHMNAIASIIISTGLIPGDPEILGYALFKTVHPENEDDGWDAF